MPAERDSASRGTLDVGCFFRFMGKIRASIYYQRFSLKNLLLLKIKKGGPKPALLCSSPFLPEPVSAIRISHSMMPAAVTPSAAMAVTTAPPAVATPAISRMPVTITIVGISISAAKPPATRHPRPAITHSGPITRRPSIARSRANRGSHRHIRRADWRSHAHRRGQHRCRNERRRRRQKRRWRQERKAEMNSSLSGQRSRANQSSREQYFSFHSFYILMFGLLTGLRPLPHALSHLYGPSCAILREK